MEDSNKLQHSPVLGECRVSAGREKEISWIPTRCEARSEGRDHASHKCGASETMTRKGTNPRRRNSERLALKAKTFWPWHWRASPTSAPRRRPRVRSFSLQRGRCRGRWSSTAVRHARRTAGAASAGSCEREYSVEPADAEPTGAQAAAAGAAGATAAVARDVLSALAMPAMQPPGLQLR